jgi:hypothetical protein
MSVKTTLQFLLCIDEQHFILSWIYHKVCHNEWYKKSFKSLFTLTIAWKIARSPRSGIVNPISGDMKMAAESKKSMVFMISLYKLYSD